MRKHIWLLLALLPIGCGSSGGSGTASDGMTEAPAPETSQPPGQPAALPFAMNEVVRFDEPWAMTFIPGTSYALVTEKPGRLILLNTGDATKTEASGVPRVDYGGQGGMGDIVMAPGGMNADGTYPVYLSWVESGSGDTRGAVVGQANLAIDDTGSVTAQLQDLRIIWRQAPKVTGRGHFAHRIAVAPDGQHIFISSGERQKFDPAQDMDANLGKIIRLKTDGSVPADNPFAAQGGVTAQIWSLGHRNGLGLAFDASGRLWESEMGPQGGDEINLIQKGGNYGYPIVSNGSHYDGRDIPDHAPGDGFVAPAAWWNPSISPAGMIYYDGAMFPQWRGSLFVGALSGQALIRLQIQGATLHKADQWPMERIREVEAGPDGAIWLLEDGAQARLLKLTPAR